MIEPEINVCIVEDTEIVFDLNGNFYSQEDQKIFYGLHKAKIIKDIIEITEPSGNIFKTRRIELVPNDYEDDTILIKNVKIGKTFHWEKNENERFLGSLKLQAIEGKIQAINIVPLEDYLLSVISSEMSATSSEELLRAHAVISRSWVMAQLEKRDNPDEKTQSEQIETEDEIIKWHDRKEHKNFDFCADDHCQRYQGVTKAYTKRVKRAIRDTHGVVLEYDGKICDTRFSKCCGGISESFENVWENTPYPYLKSVEDYKFPADGFNTKFSNERNVENWIRSTPPAYCNTADEKVLSQVLIDYDQDTRDFFRWEVSYSQKELSELLLKKTGIDFGEIIDLQPVERGHSARMIKLKIVGSKKTVTIGKELEIRSALSETHLLSSAFFIVKMEFKNNVPGRFFFKGAGWGHGVGLCQIGAAVMGAMGFKFDEILIHYFRNALIKKIYD